MKTRLTSLFDLTMPIVLAPMALASGGRLAGACARAGALGLVGGGYGDLAWTEREYRLALEEAHTPAARARIGCGFITWKLDEDASALDWMLDLPERERPRALMLSFGDPRPYRARIERAGIPLICQVQRLEQVPQALEAGAKTIVAQGAEAGGHGMNSINGRATITFVPELADWLATHAPDTLLLAAGGIADGRTLAAALLLGADGALIGSRLWATEESLAKPAAKAQAAACDGDGTARSAVFDILRRKNWPAPYDFRAIRNDLHRQWENRVDALRADPAPARAAYDAALAAGDYAGAHVTVGEATGLIRDCPPAEELVQRIAADAAALLGRR
ncbi:MAG: putative oxidoreductase, nitronate monooxygenase family [Burkholderiaceae bacterium]|jgi:nitronate monooxygenase|nr:MAG: putative oxidoreductase, nitronate monooxygenase family [Burkholderiaceae bacterium]